MPRLTPFLKTPMSGFPRACTQLAAESALHSGSATATSDGRLMMTLVSRMRGYLNRSSPCAHRGLDAVRRLSCGRVDGVAVA